MRVAVVGSREWGPLDWPGYEDAAPFEIFEQVLLGYLAPEDTLVSGGARGPDSWAALIAKQYNFPIQVFVADWETYGKRAGMLRNSEIVRNADWVIAFWDGTSRGTRDTIGKAHDAGRRVTVIFPDGRVRENRGENA